MADDDVDTHLVRYQIERGRAVDWEYATPDAEPREHQVTLGDSIEDSLGTIDVRDGDDEHSVESGDVVVVEANTDRGIKADPDSRLEAFLVTAPPPTDAEHEPVRKGLQENDFEPLNP